MELTEKGKTIILTTHYIQEAKNCNVIGFMREGTLLEEKSPRELMTAYQTTSLEDIFLQVCKRQQNTINETPTKQGLIKSNTTYKLLPDNLNFNKHHFKALIQKNFLWLKRNVRASIGLVALPILVSLLFVYSVGTNPKDMRLGIFSEGTSINYLSNSCNPQRKMYSEHLNCTLPFELMCWYMEELKGRDITLVPYDDYNQLAQDLAISKIQGAIEMDKNFTASFAERLTSTLKIPDPVVDSSILTIRLDPSNAILKLVLFNHIVKSMEIFYKKVLTSCGLSDKLYVIPTRFKEQVYGFHHHEFEQSALSGFLAVFPFYFSLVYVTSSLVEDKVLGLYDRNTASGMTYLEVVLAHLVVQMFVMILQNGIELILFFLIFGYEYMGNLMVGFVVILVLNGLGICLGFVHSELFRSELLSCYACVGWFLVSTTTLGIIWPQEGMHFLLGSVLTFMPVSTMSSTVRSVVVRGYNLFHPFVYSGLITNIGWIIIGIIITYLMHKRNKKLGRYNIKLVHHMYQQLIEVASIGPYE